ncbi:HupE/UreJ family protein [Pseudogemmatithrix spongiicola]|uniref:HupE/UreJ family protein n=1 Tax=Pseudogemmatithrix spongiicola TaxID=3062599 RepID=A0AA49K1W7_9BACT|nr:HupE/UreJ family protein [Gemmatimonadaceae bacterium 'strain 138']WKW16071.1 HupE/UreJ family protein [Gemmatimonadaceae bacterium 'strain 318']
MRPRPLPNRLATALALTAIATLVLAPSELLAHGVTAGDKGYLQQVTGVLLAPFAYLGAKHMVTGYDHLLFLAGVIFFVYRLRDVALYVTLFAIGHTVTLMGGVLLDVRVNAYLVDAVIGLSIVYKALDNLGAYRVWFGWQPDARAATLLFGLIHGLGLATKMLDYDVGHDGLLANLIAFNLGVELGQLLGLSAILIAMGYWRRSASFARHSFAANATMMSLGFLLAGYQLAGFFLSPAS